MLETHEANPYNPGSFEPETAMRRVIGGFWGRWCALPLTVIVWVGCSSSSPSPGASDVTDAAGALDIVSPGDTSPTDAGMDTTMDTVATDVATEVGIEIIVVDTLEASETSVADLPAADVPDDDATTSDEGLSGDATDALDIEVTPAMLGCSDGTREGFVHRDLYPNAAACGGAWTVPGIHHADGNVPAPACDRQAGNDGYLSSGQGCNVEDLCAAGWHVCKGRKDVLASTGPNGCADIMVDAQSPAFFLARTSSTGAFNCTADISGDPDSLNDLFGCGDMGCPISPETYPSCPPLTTGSHDMCKSIRLMEGCSCSMGGDGVTVTCTPVSGGCGWCKPLDYWNTKLGESLTSVWQCDDGDPETWDDGTQEAANVTKTDPDRQGGVLCCRD